MLTKELLVTRRSRGRIYPRFVDPSSQETLRVAQNVIELFEAHLGKRRGELHKALEKLETHKTFKLVRGLAQLLERQAVFETHARIEPQVARRRLFAQGYVTGPEERKARLQQVAQELSQEVGIELAPQDLEEALRADREEHQVLRGFQPQPTGAPGGELQPHLEWKPKVLLKQYNLSLAQTLLFDALDVVFEVSGNYQPIFLEIKRLGLMYEAVEEMPGQVQVRVDGPASLLKETTKYGTALAKLLPALVRAPRFRLQARIIKDGSKPLIFELDHTKRVLFPLGPEEAEGGEADTLQEASFDSAVERDFYYRIRGVMRDWQVQREPTILKAGPYVFIPDFGFAQPSSELCYYLEIVGFWTPEYLQKKLAKLREVEAPLLVAVDEALACSEADLQRLRGTGKEVFLYKKRLPLEPVVKRLLELAEARTRQELKALEAQGDMIWAELQKQLKGQDRISLGELASKLRVGPEALLSLVKQGLEGGRLTGYRLIEEQLISEQLLERVKAELEALPRDGESGGGGGWSLESVLSVLKRHGLGESALKAIGFKVERESLLRAWVVPTRSSSS
jgi:hypothetical protein